MSSRTASGRRKTKITPERNSKGNIQCFLPAMAPHQDVTWPLRVYEGEHRAVPPGTGLKMSPNVTFCCSFLTSSQLRWPDLHSLPLKYMQFKSDIARL